MHINIKSNKKKRSVYKEKKLLWCFGHKKKLENHVLLSQKELVSES